MPATPPLTSAEGAPLARVVVERPPEGLARGKYPVPAWTIGLLGGVLVALGLGYLLLRLRRAGNR